MICVACGTVNEAGEKSCSNCCMYLFEKKVEHTTLYDHRDFMSEILENASYVTAE